jgi:hypothetical protein
MGIRVCNFLIDFEKADNRLNQSTGGWGFGRIGTGLENFDLARHSTYKKFFSFQNTIKFFSFTITRKRRNRILPHFPIKNITHPYLIQ